MPVPAAAFGTLTKPDMTVSPAITEWVMKPGETQTKVIKVINPKDSPIPMRVVVKGLEVQEEIMDKDSHIFDASNWFTVADPYFILGAKETRDIKVTLRMPKDAEPGGHYATIYFQQFIPVSAQKQTIVAGQIGTLAFITANKKVEKRLETAGRIRMLTQADGSANISLTLRNPGNVHLLPTGKFIISDWQGKVITTLLLPAGIVLPHTERVYTANWKTPPLMGHFTVKAEVNYGETNQQLAPLTRGFWIFPGGWIIEIAVLLVAVWWFGFRIRKRWMRVFKVLFGKSRD